MCVMEGDVIPRQLEAAVKFMLWWRKVRFMGAQKRRKGKGRNR
jgi:hypothetical protein